MHIQLNISSDWEDSPT